MRIHKPLQCTPAMEAKIIGSFWSWEDFFNYGELKQVA